MLTKELKLIITYLGKSLQNETKKNIYINKICQKLGVTETNNNIDEKITSIFEKIDTLLEKKEEKFFYDNIPVVFFRYLKDERLVELLNIVSNNRKSHIIANYKDDEKKMADINLFSNDSYIVIASLKDDDLKEKLLNKIAEEDKYSIINSLKNDDKKIKLLRSIKDENCKLQVIKGISDDDKKNEQIKKLKDKIDKVSVIVTLRSDEKKLEWYKVSKKWNVSKDVRINIERAILTSLEDDDKKLELLQNRDCNAIRKDLIASLKNEDKKIEFLNSNNISDIERIWIIRSLLNEEVKIKELERLIDKYPNGIIKDDNGKNFSLNSYIMVIACDLVEENDKLKILQKMNKIYFTINIINSLDDEDIKIEQYEQLIESIDKEKTKLNRTEEYDIIKNINVLDISEDKKIKLSNNIQTPYLRANLISTVKDEKVKMEFYREILDKEAKLLIISSLKDKKKRFELYCQMQGIEISEDIIEKKYSNIGLPKDMTIGIEIECEGRLGESLQYVRELYGYNVKRDGSLQNGIELTSPILHDDIEDVNSIYKICNILHQLQYSTSKRCGGHVHIGANYLKSIEELKELYELYGNAEKIIYLISNEKGQIPRRSLRKYAKTISGKFKRNKIKAMDTEKDEFLLDAKRIQGDRYYGLNIMNIGNILNTIEFRGGNGTINANEWIERICLYGRIMQVAKKVADINKRLAKGQTITEEEKNILINKRIIKNSLFQFKKKKALFNILFNEEERNVYEEKYKINRRKSLRSLGLKMLSFGKVDFGEIYENTMIPDDIINNLKKDVLQENERVEISREER